MRQNEYLWSKGLMPNSLPNDNFLDWSKLKAFADDILNLAEKLKFVLARVENIVGERGNRWLPAFSPFPTMFSKSFFPRVSKRIVW